MVDDPKLSSTADKTTFSDINNEIYLSLASAWEMAIKASLKKLKLPLPAKEYVLARTQAHQIKLLDIAIEHIGVVETLPLHHRDPFDRLIIAQSISDNLHILSDDGMFDAYPIRRIW